MKTDEIIQLDGLSQHSLFSEKRTASECKPFFPILIFQNCSMYIKNKHNGLIEEIFYTAYCDLLFQDQTRFQCMQMLGILIKG